MLLAGDSFSGKTFAYLRLALRMYNRAKEANVRPPALHVIDTNDTMAKYLYPGGEFDMLAFDQPGGNVYPYPCFEWKDVTNAWTSIQKAAQTGDWIVADLASQIYDYAQVQVATARNKILSDEAYMRALTGKGFGAFAAEDWQLVKLIHEPVINGIFNHPRLNSIVVAHLQEIVDVEGRNKREALLLFDELGLKPRGPQLLYQQPDTVMLLWAKREITRDGAKRVGHAKTVRKLELMKDRGIPMRESRVFDRDAFDILDEIRADAVANRHINSNATARDDVERIMASKEESIRDTEDEDDTPS